MSDKIFSALVYALFFVGLSCLVISVTNFNIFAGAIGIFVLLLWFTIMYGSNGERHREKVERGLSSFFLITAVERHAEDNPKLIENVFFTKPDTLRLRNIKDGRLEPEKGDIIIMDYPNYPAFRIVHVYPSEKYFECECLDNRCTNVGVYHFGYGKFYRISLTAIRSRIVYVKSLL